MPAVVSVQSPVSPARPDAPGDVVRLDDGLCHFRDEGPRDGPLVTLIHGATVPAWEFDRLVPYLHAAGFRTLRADLFGHGRSARPRVTYDPGLFVRQWLELGTRLGLARPGHLIGHSLGAAIAARLIAAAPARFRRAVFGAPLVDYMANMPATRLLLVPGLGECLMATYVVPMLRRRRRRNYRMIEDGRFVGLFMDQVRQPGFGRALLSMFRAGTLGPQHACYAALGRLPHPVLVLRGSADAIMPAHHVEALMRALPAARYVELPGTAHAFPLTHPELAAPAIVEFLAGDR